MTSRRCFFKFMKEDLRHKVWMIVLSFLGSLLTGPVLYLILRGNFMDERVLRQEGSWFAFRSAAERIFVFFGPGLCIGGGLVALIGAVIVGLFGFRYLFHKNMADIYHSIPMKRRALFLAGYLNGLLIWFVPFVICFLITLSLGVFDLARLKKLCLTLPPQAGVSNQIVEALSGSRLIAETLLTVGVLCICFLLVYHLVLAAVMLCGNMLNTLAVTGLLGCGVIMLYGLVLLLFESSMDTFITDAVTIHRQLIYGSPLVSAVWLLIRQLARVEDASCFIDTVKVEPDFVRAVALNLALALALGAAAVFLYNRRPSELAEQGVRNRPVRFLLQLLAGIMAGIGGWLLFYFVVGDLGGAAQGWATLGAVLACVVVFGALDVIFRMDFKAFVSHKAFMGGTVAATLLLCFALHGDWLGYDTYLPEADQIAQIAVLDRNCKGSYYSYSSLGILEEENPMNRMQLTDRETAYAFLKEAVAFEKARESSDGEDVSVWGSLQDTFLTKVTLTDGRTYYRRYSVTDKNCAAAYALVTDREYVQAVYGISEQEILPEEGFSVVRNGQTWFFAGDGGDKELLHRICEAYEKDIRENPGAFIDQGGRLLCQVAMMAMYPRDPQARISFNLDVYEEMENVTAVLQDSKAWEAVRIMEAEEIQQIHLGLNRTYGQLEEGTDLEDLARELYEVYPEPEVDLEEGGASGIDRAGTHTMSAQSGESKRVAERENQPVEVVVTDPAQIEELLGLLSYARPMENGIFKPGMLDAVTAVDKEGNETTLFIEEGALPEKYILRFAGLLTGEDGEPGSGKAVD